MVFVTYHYFLGLQTLDILAETQRLIALDTGKRIDFNEIPLNDKDTFEHIFQTGKTGKVFQFESSGMQNLLRRMKPTCMADLCAANAAYRPGPMQFLDEFINGRNNPDSVQYPTPEYEQIAKETMGILFYQEQIMQIVQAMAGFTLGQADILRRGIGKKEKKYIDEGRERFVKGCAQLGTADEKTAKYIYSTIEKFANYGFNKSHSDAYGLVAYWCAYLKEHFPECFMAANLTICSHDVDRLAYALAETNRMGVSILPPDIRFSSSCFTLESTPTGQKAIRFSLAAIKSIREENAEKYMQADKRSLFHFLLSLPSGSVRKNQIVNLICAGAFDYLGARKALIENLDALIDSIKMLNVLQTVAVPSCLSSFLLEDANNHFEYDMLTKLHKEKDCIQIALSGHPVSSVRNLTNMTTTLADYMGEDTTIEDSQEITLLGMLSDYRTIQTKKGDTMAFAMLEDEFSSMDTVFFPRTYEELADTIDDCLDMPVLITGKLKLKDNFEGKPEYSLIVSDIEKVLKQSVAFFIDSRDMTDEMIGEMTKYNGLAEVYSVDVTNYTVQKLDFSVDINPAILKMLKKVRCVVKKP